MQNAQTLPTAVLTKHAPVWYVEATDLDTSLSRGIRRLVKGGMLRPSTCNRDETATALSEQYETLVHQLQWF